MMKKLVWKVFKIIVIWFSLSSIIYLLFNISNPNVATVILRVNNIQPTTAAIKAEQARLGLDESLWRRYIDWWQSILHGDLGQSYVSGDEVGRMLLQALPNTLLLAGGALVLIIITIILYGKLALNFQETLLEKGARVVIFLLNAIPSFWFGLILLEIFAVYFKILPISSNSYTSFILPIITLAAMYCSTYARLIRKEILVNKHALYVKYYYLRGFSTKEVNKKIFHNSLQSVLTSLSVSIPKIIAGSAVVETLFAVPGLGYLCVQAIQNRDLPVLEGYVVILLLLFLVISELFNYLERYFQPEMRS